MLVANLDRILSHVVAVAVSAAVVGAALVMATDAVHLCDRRKIADHVADVVTYKRVLVADRF